MTSAPFPPDPDATSVITWGTSADPVPDPGRHRPDDVGTGESDPRTGYPDGGHTGGYAEAGHPDAGYADHGYADQTYADAPYSGAPYPGTPYSDTPNPDARYADTGHAAPAYAGSAYMDKYSGSSFFETADGDTQHLDPDRSDDARRPSPGPSAGVSDDALHPVPMPQTPYVDTVGEVLPPAVGEAVTCPECGTAAHVTLNRREALDFCHTCDYPLFWVPTKILRGPGDRSDESLRRLPGQSGRVSVASLPCPSCSEQNAVNARTCVRCGADMHPVQPPPPPPPAPVYYAPPPPPMIEPEPEPGVAWWVWLLFALGTLAIAVLIVLIVTGVIG